MKITVDRTKCEGYAKCIQATPKVFKLDKTMIAEVIDRPKRGFAVPLASWFRGELEGFARELLLSRRCRERNIFNHAYVERVLDLHRGGRPLDFQLWTLISFEMWCRTFVDTRTQPRFAVAAGASA